MLRKVTPTTRPQEQSLAIPPLVGLPVKSARGNSDGEIRDRYTTRGVPEFRIRGEITHHRDRGVIHVSTFRGVDVG